MPTTLLKQKKLFLISGLVALAFVVFYWQYSLYFPSTDNAYVQANIVNIAPQVSGNVEAVAVQNHQYVKKGDFLFSIDPTPFKIVQTQAQAQLDIAKQNVAADVDAVNSANAVVEQRTVQYKNAQQDSIRAIKLAKEGVLSKQAADDATANIATAKAALDVAVAQAQQAKDTLGKIGDENAYLKQAEAALAQAELNLSYTKIFATADGNVENLNLRIGDVVTTNTPVFALIDNSQWWIEANYNETDLERIRPGQSASITLDMYPGKTFKGIVENISRGSGATFSLLPPENATGNWVKVTQRFPVRVRLVDVTKNAPPRVGASATVEINTWHQ